MFSGYTFRILWNLYFQKPLFAAISPTAFSDASQNAIGILDMIGGVFVGVIGGLVGILFIILHLTIVRFRRIGAKRFWIIRNPYPYAIVVMILTVILLFPELIGDYMALLPVAAFRDLSVTGPISNAEADWDIISIWVSVPLFIFSRFFLTAFAVSLPIPAGLFVPIITVGAGVGRLTGEILSPLIQSDPQLSQNIPGIMAVVGAAGVGAGVTQTFSVAVIIFELTGQIVLLVPVTVCLDKYFLIILFCLYFIIRYQLLLL